MLKYRQINQRKHPPRKLLLAPVRKLAHLILTKLPNQKSALVKRLVLVLVLNVVRMDERCEFLTSGNFKRKNYKLVHDGHVGDIGKMTM